MYARQPPERKYPRSVRVPHNYSGNAFRREKDTPFAAPAEQAEPVSEEPSELSFSLPPNTEDRAGSEQSEGSEAPTDTSAGKLFSAPGFQLDLGRLFGKEHGRGIGLEELLLLGLILLVSQSDTKDDLALLLLLLLFIQ